jgi:transglutaminase-like putative cysteine protease
MAVPYYGIKIDPVPKNIPLVGEVTPYHVDQLLNETPTLTSTTRADMLKLVISDHQAIRNMAVRIATASCRESDICYAKAIFYFVRDNFQYVGDPPNDYLESPFETIYTGGADCDGMAILLANLESAVGIPTRFAFIPNHVYVQVKIDDAPKKYKEEDGWISLDPTCSDCEFGEIPYSTLNKRKEYLYT